MDPIRINFNKCGQQSFTSFIQNINNSKNFIFKSHNPADQSVMQDRYTFSKDKCRISIVYETKAQTLVITAPQGVMSDIEAMLPNDLSRQSAKEAHLKSAVRTDSADKPQSQKILIREKHKIEKNVSVSKDENKVEEKKQESIKTNISATRPSKPDRKKQKSEERRPKESSDTSSAKRISQKSKNEKQSVKTNENMDMGKVFLIKKVSMEKFTELLKKIKANKSMRYKLMPSTDGGKTYSISALGEKALIRFVGGNLQLNGTQGDLYSELQLMMSQISDYKTAINSHIKLMGEEKRPGEVEKQLKKKLPAAFEFLSEQSKIDLAIGIIDINNSAVVLSDYSTLLIPCFRGLERLIFDLQHAQGIVVKMIGQAYEKEDGNYVLKSGYRRKIPSVIYAEVMSALYTEYFKQRNFYAHSDGGYDNVSRIISDKQQVQSIFNHILDVINYNGKKLKEIGFRI